MKIIKIVSVIVMCLSMSLVFGCGDNTKDINNTNEVISLDEENQNMNPEEATESENADEKQENEKNEKIDDGKNSDNELVTTENDKKNISEDDGSLESKNDNTQNEKEIKNDNEENKGKVKGDTPFGIHGKLTVKGTKLTDQNGEAFQIQGVSTHGLSWFPEYVNPDAFKSLRDEWGANCIRLAMYTGEGGYCTGANQVELSKLVDSGVSYATQLGMYAIIDWHILSDNDPNTYKTEAMDFFADMSAKYAKSDNVIYEICNEPNGGTSWSDIKKYALDVIPVIKKNNPDAIIVVGTPTWSQDVDQAANDPITGYSNIMYTLHFYADTHKDSLRNKMTDALKKGMPIFVTEFGICDASGNGSINIDEANKWIELMNKNGVGYCIWNLSNKAEASALIYSGCTKKSGWTNDDLSDEGRWYLGVLGASIDVGNSLSDEDNTTNATTDSTTKGDTSGNNDKSGNSKSYNNMGMKVTVSPSGNWDDGKKDYSQFTINVMATDSDVNDWKLQIVFDNDVKLDQNWSGNYELTDSKNLVITPVDYNTTIKKGEKAELGFIVSSSGNLNISSVKIIK